MSDRRELPALGRLILAAFVWVFFLAAAYVLLDALGLWSRLPAALTWGIDIATGLVLAAALIVHLVLATGKLPGPTKGGQA
jgi:hypothetical protein